MNGTVTAQYGPLWGIQLKMGQFCCEKVSGKWGKNLSSFEASFLVKSDLNVC